MKLLRLKFSPALLAALLLLSGQSALSLAAASPPKGDDHGGEASDADIDKEVARSVELGGLVFPVFDETGGLRNYIFVNARMLVADGKDPWKYREQAHFIRDAVLRAAHRKSFHLEGNFGKLDEKRAAEESLRASNEAVKEQGALISMTFTQIASQAGR